MTRGARARGGWGGGGGGGLSSTYEHPMDASFKDSYLRIKQQQQQQQD